jgi:MFS family permease
VALLGDSLLYAVLPLHAATFGISLAWVGVLLSANRIIRLFVYPLLPRLATTGLRRFTIAASALGGVTTLTFAVASGAWLLLASRIAWGVVFGALSLSTLAYATVWSEVAGKRVGLSLALREVGPLFSLTIGAAAVSMAGVRPTLAALGMMSLAGVIVAMRLPELKIANGESRTALRLPVAADWLSLAAGFVTDGIFPATIGLLIARSSGAGEAVIGAGLLLGIKRVSIVALAPVSGHASDRFGGRIVAAVGFGIAAAGALLIAFDVVIAGAILISCGAATTTTAIPVSIAARDREERVGAFARSAMARDVGAAAGPLVALASFDAAGASAVFSVAGTMLAVIAIWLAGPHVSSDGHERLPRRPRAIDGHRLTRSPRGA